MKASSKKTTAKKGNGARKGKVSTTAEGRIPLKKICQELGLDPKRSRVKLRRAWRKTDEKNVAFHSKGGRWDLTKREAAEVRAILSA